MGAVVSETPTLESTIVPLTVSEIPSVLSFDRTDQKYVIGGTARSLGIKGQTNAFNFKPDLGLSPAKFERDKKYWVLADESGRHAPAYTLAPKEVVSRYLETLLGQFPERPEALLVGEPAIREKTWREYFRSHYRRVLLDLGFPEPQFFPEPFAVFQYYRQVAGLIPVVDEPQTILVIDFGGGTFDTCIIQTASRGNLARGGAKYLPLGVQSVPIAGRDIDRLLLEEVVKVARKSGVVFKDDPIKRAESFRFSVLLIVEDAKIKLSERLHGVSFEQDCARITEDLVAPQTTLLPNRELRLQMTGEHLKNVISKLWHRELGSVLHKCIEESEAHLGRKIDALDKVLLAGGSARLPFLRQFIFKSLPTLLRSESDIVIGSRVGEAVAYGIAAECREQVRRFPQLASDRIAPFVLNDLFLCFSKTRGEHSKPAIIRRQHSRKSIDGHLLEAPLETGDLSSEYILELPFAPKKQLFYWFTSGPVAENAMEQGLNVTHDLLSVPPRASRKLRLRLKFLKDGLIEPHFEFQIDAPNGSTGWHPTKCEPFYFAGFKIVPGRRYFGLDFGTSNSYVVQFLSPVEERPQTTEYPQFRLPQRSTQHLRELELRLQGLRESGVLSERTIREHASSSKLPFVFHSNKIEGSPLTKGETEEAFDVSETTSLSSQQLAAINSGRAFEWVLGNFPSVLQEPEAFMRQINKLTLAGIGAGGAYRTGPVKISGTTFTPPPAAAVPDLMRQLASEICERRADRSAIELATSAHTTLVWIHPFEDGNGRTARLLIAAILLALELPLVVINFDERERYMDALQHADDGDLSPILDLILECFDQSLATCTAEPQIEPTNDVGSKAGEVEPAPPAPPSLTDSVDAALKAVESAKSQTQLESRPRTNGLAALDYDLLNKVMEEKTRAETARYEAWSQAFQSVAKEAEALTAEFNRSYARRGYSASFRPYDMLSEEKFNLLASGQRAPRTWFFGLELRSFENWLRLVLFFQRSSYIAHRLSGVAPVSLTVSRFDGEKYSRVVNEPVWLREIAYAQGNLVPLGSEGASRKPIAQALLDMLTEMIRSYM